MKNLLKFLPYVGLSLVMLVVGAVIANRAEAVMGPIDCNSQNPTFVGNILCSIGSATDGISGTQTLFQGQKAIADKINNIGGGSSSGASVYLERQSAPSGESGSNSILLGKIFTGSVTNIWGCSSATGTSVPNCPFTTMSGSSAGVGNSIVFVPNLSGSDISYSQSSGGLTVNPTLCFVYQRRGTNAGSADNVFDVTVHCAYTPNMENGDVVVFSKSYSSSAIAAPSTPINQQYRISVK